MGLITFGTDVGAGERRLLMAGIRDDILVQRSDVTAETQKLDNLIKILDSEIQQAGIKDTIFLTAWTEYKVRWIGFREEWWVNVFSRRNGLVAMMDSYDSFRLRFKALGGQTSTTTSEAPPPGTGTSPLIWGAVIIGGAFAAAKLLEAWKK